MQRIRIIITYLML